MVCGESAGECMTELQYLVICSVVDFMWGFVFLQGSVRINGAYAYQSLLQYVSTVSHFRFTASDERQLLVLNLSVKLYLCYLSTLYRDFGTQVIAKESATPRIRLPSRGHKSSTRVLRSCLTIGR